MQIYAIEPGKLLRIGGPAAVRVIEGEVYVMGKIYGPDSRFTVLRARKVIVKPRTAAKLEITLGPDGSVEEARPEEEVVDIWEDTISKLNLDGVTIILGAMDVGKTTLTVMLANKIANNNKRVGIIDADLGQNDLGPPATVDAAILEPGQAITHLRMLRPVKAMFLKTTSVERVWQDVITAVKKLSNYLLEVEKVSSVIVNTDGWISTERAVEYKTSLVEKLEPSNVIVIKRADEADNLLKSLQERVCGRVNIVVLPAPPAARIRSKEDRRIHREMGYGKYLTPPRDVSIDLKSVPIINFPICAGTPLGQDLLGLVKRVVRQNIIHCELIGGCMVAVVPTLQKKDPEILDMPAGGKVILLPQGWERGLLVGLEDENNFLLALGRLKKIYYNNAKAIVTVSKNFTDLSRVHHIRLGMIRLNEQFEEMEKVNYITRLENLVLSKRGK